MLLFTLQNLEEEIKDDSVHLNKDTCVKSNFDANGDIKNEVHDDENEEDKVVQFDQIVLKMMKEISVKEEKEVHYKVLEFEDEEEFHPELFGLLEDPGVLRFDCVDYPQAAIEEFEENVSDEKWKTSEKVKRSAVSVLRSRSLNMHDIYMSRIINE